MACRTFLLKLEARGLIRLPPRHRPPVNARRNRRRADLLLDESRLEGRLEEFLPLRTDVVRPGTVPAEVSGALLQRHHYLSHRNCVGENLRYLARARSGRPIACLSFGSAARQYQPRDACIGWTPQQRQSRLPLITTNTRFLIPEWVRIAHLASHVLAAVTRRLSRDWQQKYGHPIHLVETFVQPDRFAGTAYRAAGWWGVSLTQGRGRNAARTEPRCRAKKSTCSR